MSSPDETPPTSTADTSRRRGRIIAVAVGLVAVAAVVLALVLTGRGDDSPGAGGSPEPSAGSSSSSSTGGDEVDGTASAEPTDGPADELRGRESLGTGTKLAVRTRRCRPCADAG